MWPRKDKAPLEGRAGPSSKRCRLLEGTNSERVEEEGVRSAAVDP